MKPFEKMVAGDVIHEVSAAELLVSCGVLLAHWASVLSYTDAAYGDGWLDDNCEIMATMAEMLYVLYKANIGVFENIVVKAPDDVVGFVMRNPLGRNSMSGKEEPNDSSIPTDEGDEPSLGDIPF